MGVRCKAGNACSTAACIHSASRQPHAPLCSRSLPTLLTRFHPTPPLESLGYLVNKNRTEQLQEVVAALCTKLLTSNKEQQRDVASLGLKTVVAGG